MLIFQEVKKLSSTGFCYSQSENKRKRKDRKILGCFQRAEKSVEYEGDIDTNCWCALNDPQEPGRESGGTRDQRKNRDY